MRRHIDIAAITLAGAVLIGLTMLPGPAAALELRTVPAAYGHLAPASVLVAEGARVEVGQEIAAVGGTGEGNRSVHLHIQLNEGPDTLYAQGAPLHFAEEGRDFDTGRFIRSE